MNDKELCVHSIEELEKRLGTSETTLESIPPTLEDTAPVQNEIVSPNGFMIA